jgi:hypothetical protein
MDSNNDSDSRTLPVEDEDLKEDTLRLSEHEEQCDGDCEEPSEQDSGASKPTHRQKRNFLQLLDMEELTHNPKFQKQRTKFNSDEEEEEDECQEVTVEEPSEQDVEEEEPVEVDPSLMALHSDVLAEMKEKYMQTPQESDASSVGLNNLSHSDASDEKKEDEVTPSHQQDVEQDVTNLEMQNTTTPLSSDVPVSSQETFELTPPLTEEVKSLVCRFDKPCQVYGIRKSNNKIFGGIIVNNLSYEKQVFVRMSTNSWKTFQDFNAKYCSSIDEKNDAFQFEIELQPVDKPVEVQLAACYRKLPEMNEFWDNNFQKII